MKLIIQNDRIAATALPEHQPTGFEQAVIDAPGDFDPARMGDYVWQDGALVLPPAPLRPISAMQLAAALLLAGKITAAEARAFGRAGVIPASIEPAIIASLTAAGLDATAREIALLQLESATEYHRDHPVTPLIGAAMNMDAAALDALWAAALQIV